MEALPGSRDHEHFEALMERRWAIFTRCYVLPHLYPLTRPVFSLEAVRNEMSAIVEHHTAIG